MDNPGDAITPVELTDCPRCGYSLAGLPGAWRCPECGFEYDDRTFVLVGISRGTSGLPVGRKWLWILLGIGVVFGPTTVFLAGALGGLRAVVFVPALWIGLFVFLMRTGRSERKGIEHFIFAAGGFGYCADIALPNPMDARLIGWDTVDSVQIERKSANWHRLQIGTERDLNGALRSARLDAGVRCDAATAQWVRAVLEERIRAAHSGTDSHPAD